MSRGLKRPQGGGGGPPHRPHFLLQGEKLLLPFLALPSPWPACLASSGEPSSQAWLAGEEEGGAGRHFIKPQ